MESLLQCRHILDIHWDCNSMEHEILLGADVQVQCRIQDLQKKLK